MVAMGTRKPLDKRAVRRITSRSGYSLVEVIVAMALFGVLARIAVPHFDARRMQINAAQRLVIANLRLARAKAITKSVHFRIDFANASQVRIAQMVQDGAGVWSVDDTKTKTIALPASTRFASGTQCTSPCQAIIGTNIEFNSRGISTNLAAVEQITLIDDFGKAKALQAWPSGQINEL
jgi:prepilin-type N-terminal cleavage/methylation domain-containing protein